MSELATEDRQVDRLEESFVASSWTLMARKFKKHKLAIAGAIILCVLYLVGAIAPDFFSTSHAFKRYGDFTFAPPQRIRLLHHGQLRRPFVYGYRLEVHPETLRNYFIDDEETIYPIRFFIGAEQYKLLGLFKTRLRFMGVDEPGTLFLFGTDTPGPRRVLAHPDRSQNIAHGWTGRRCHELRTGVSARRHIRVFRRHAGHDHPAHRRVPDQPAVDPAVDGAGRRGTAGVAGGAHLLHDYHYTVDRRLDRSCPRGARQAAAVARRGLRDRGQDRGHEGGWHHCKAPPAGLHELSHRAPDAGDSGHDSRRDGAEFHRCRSAAAGAELGGAAATGAECQDGGAESVAAHAGDHGRDYRPVFQLRRGWGCATPRTPTNSSCGRGSRVRGRCGYATTRRERLP